MANERVTQKICSLENCTKISSTRGWCKHHYDMWRLHGNPAHIGRYRTTSIDAPDFPEYFWSKVDKTPGLGRDGDCWEWRGTSTAGYGSIVVEHKTYKAHRLSWQFANHRAPKLLILHSCDNPPCVNPDHLREGTDADNSADRVSRGRSNSRKGEECANVILTENQVRHAKIMLKNGESRRQVADVLQCTINIVGHIDRGQNWKHVIID